MSTNPNIKNTQRPLSPHLQIYKPQITSVMSIFHRITGVGIALSLVFFVWFLIALADGVDSYNCFRLFLVSIVGKLTVFAVVIGLYYHLFNGIRHLLWDAGHGYKIDCVTRSGITVLILTGIFSLFTVFSLAI